MPYQANITSYNHFIIDGRPAIVIRQIAVHNDKGEFIRNADLLKIEKNLKNMVVHFGEYREYIGKDFKEVKAVRNIMQHAPPGYYLQFPDKDIVLDWFCKCFPKEYRQMEGKYTDVCMDYEKKAVIFVNNGEIVKVFERIEI